MWSVNQAPARLERTSSVHSIISDRSSNASNEDFDSFLPRGAGMWTAPPLAPQREIQQSSVARLSQKFGNIATISVVPLPSPPPSRQHSRHRGETAEDDVRSRSSTLRGDEVDYEDPDKTPTPDSMMMKLIDLDPVEELMDDVQPEVVEIQQNNSQPEVEEIDQEEGKPEQTPTQQPPHIPGPLETQLQALMSKLISMEQENPTISITPSEYQTLQSRVQALEAEKRAWHTRHEALFALRDEDVANTIKLRGLLAAARRDLEGITKLRDDDLVNLQEVRGKLAEATRKLERGETMQSGSGRGTPTSTSGRGRPSSLLIERRDTTDLFAAAKAAALEQRALELEKRNEDLLAQIEGLKASSSMAEGDEGAGIDELNRVAAHKAWKETVADLNAKLKAKDDELARLRTASASSPSPLVLAPAVSGSYDWHRMEALHEEHASYRERVGGKMQGLRAEKEELQRALHQREDECHVLEARVQSLQRRVGVA